MTSPALSALETDLAATAFVLARAERRGQNISKRAVLRVLVALPEADKSLLVALVHASAAIADRLIDTVAPSATATVIPIRQKCDNCKRPHESDELEQTQSGRHLCGYCLLEVSP